jgi:alpha-glucosidase (family GH31 glycosyl hydrolase)
MLIMDYVRSYTFLYNKAVYEAMVQERGLKEACLFARSATAGGQRYATSSIPVGSI